ncbi:MAG: PH domain-containing protein [Candidatus Blackburnbacteria bacterium]|nr:PH domain-containing protein [Candidatus Blackburnbacteria bacterium]
MRDVYVSQPAEKEIPQERGVPLSARRLPQHHHLGPRVMMKPFSAYAYCPLGVRFENQEEGEEIVLFLRQHPIVNIPWILTTVVMVLAPLILRNFPILDFLPLNFQVVSVLIWYLLTTAFILENALDWLFNIYIVTTQRIVDIDFFNLIQKQVSDAERVKIQDVTYTLGGVFGTLFNFGDVFIQTAGTAPNFDFHNVPKPSGVVKTLQEFERSKEGLE